MVPRSPSPPKPPTDQRILDIAADHIRRYGAERITVTSVAEEAGMSHANVYRYYPSKTALIDAITTDWLKPLEAGLRIIVDAPDPAYDKLERLLFAVHRAYRQKLATDPKIFGLFVEATEMRAEIIRKHRDRIALEIRRILEEGANGGLFTIADENTCVALIFDAAHRFIDPGAVKLDIDLSRAALEERAARVVGLVLQALAKGEF
jgi:AcrR family transcriptional regulator